MMMRAAPVVVATQPLSVSPRAPVDSAAANAAATAAQVFAADQRRCSIETMAPSRHFPGRHTRAASEARNATGLARAGTFRCKNREMALPTRARGLDLRQFQTMPRSRY